MMRSVLRTLCAVSLIAFALPAIENRSAVGAQEKQPDLQYQVQVTLKLVQVYVTDKKGLPVVDLNKEDFSLMDEGKLQKITEFERHVVSLARAKEEAPPQASEPFSQELLPRKFFLLFDFAFNNGIGLEKARKAAVHFIDEELRPTDEVALLSYSAIKSLKMHEYLTTDHKKVRDVVRRIGMESISGRAESFEAQYWQAKSFANPTDATRSGSVFDPKDIFGQESEWAWDQSREESKMQAHNFAIKMTELAKALRYIPGNKHIILLSSGVPYSLIYGVQSPYGKIGVEDFGEFWLAQKFEDMLKELSATNCSIYTLDTQDLAASISGDLKVEGSSSLQKLSGATGGKYFGNINNYEQHVEKIQELTGCYYVLGYYVDGAWDGAYRKIRVDVGRPGCTILAQRGYYNPKPFKEYDGFEKILHLMDLALSEEPLLQAPLRFAIQVVPCAPGAKGNLCLAAQVPLEQIREIMTGPVEMITVIFDEKEDIAAFKKSQVKVSSLKGERVSFGGSFALPAGHYKCRFVIRNLESGRAAVGSTGANVWGQ